MIKPPGVKRLPHRKHFAASLLRNVIAASLMLIFSLTIGTTGYVYFFRIGWVDGFYNASMILTGMGPVDTPISESGKIFASFYAIYSGVAFLTCVAVIFAPVLHRFLHKFRLDVEQ
ncbi:MAG: hypothetical protein H0W61_17110 [Bacteroidetes bacterium]|nr:hypothetical protein [Bacteroidota bacterium]